MRIGIVATRLDGISGASLEAAKWAAVLSRMGHEVFSCAGGLDPFGLPGMLVPEMHYQHPLVEEVQRVAFAGMDSLPDLDADIERKAQSLTVPLQAFIEDFRLEALVVENLLALPGHLPLGVALYETIKATQIPTIAHHHDFYWDRAYYLVNRIPFMLHRVFPPDLPSIQHVVINSVMQRELRARCGIEATVIPNVMDFANPPAPPDEYAQNFREDMGFWPDATIVLQPTQVVARKSIERAIELVEMLGTTRPYHFVITGEGSTEPGAYFEWLFERAVRAGIEIYFIGDRIGRHRETVGGERMYTLHDVYPQASLVTFLSRHEGFGNGLLEAMYFKCPVVVNRYPAYRADIGPLGIQAVEIDEIVTPRAAVDVFELLDDPARMDLMTACNYEIGQEHFSYEVLEQKLTQVLERL